MIFHRFSLDFDGFPFSCQYTLISAFLRVPLGFWSKIAHPFQYRLSTFLQMQIACAA